jgi:hypothetical protein
VNGSATNDDITAINGRVTVAGDLPVNYNPVTLLGLTINGLGGNDTLTVDSTTGPVLTPISYDGGAGSDKLVLQGGAATSDTYSPGPNPGQGTSTLVFVGGTETVGFTNLEPVVDTVVSPLLTVNGTGGDDAINYTDDPANPGNGLVSVNNFETISFLNKTSLIIAAGAGSDTINLNDPATPTGLTGITVNGGDPTSSGDTLVVNGTTGVDAIGYTINSATSSTITGAGPVSITGNDVEQVLLNGQGGGDTLTVTTVVGFDQATLDAGAAMLIALREPPTTR